MTPVNGTLPAFVAVKDEIPVPEPLTPKPIAGLVFVQLNTVPLTVLLKTTPVVAVPAHKVSSAMADSIGVGFTVIVKLCVLPTQLVGTGPLGMMVMVATTGTLLVFTAVNDGIFPVPEAAKPILVLLHAQVKTVFATELTKLTGKVGAPLQTT